MAILAFSAGFVILNAPPPRAPAKAAAERFAARVQVSLDEAVLNGLAIRLEYSEAGYALARYQGGAWVRFAEGPAASARGGRSVRMSLERLEEARDNAVALNPRTALGDADDAAVYVVLDPLSGADPFRAVFDDGEASWAVAVDRSGTPEVSRGRP